MNTNPHLLLLTTTYQHTYTHAHTVPAVPMLLSVLPSVKDHSPALKLSWSWPYSDIPIADFMVEYWMQRHHVYSVVTNRTSTTLARLALGAGYTVRVAARSALGQGHFSAVQNTITLNGEKVQAPSLLLPHNITNCLCV